MFKEIKKHLTSVVFPAHCLHCETELAFASTYQWCSDCLRAMRGLEPADCLRCGAHLQQTSPFPDGCAVCQKTNLHFEAAISIGNYQGQLQKLIREMKRTKSESIAFQLGQTLGATLQDFSLGLDADVITPVPTHWWKKLYRGFRASALIAEGLSTELGRSKQDVLKCVRLTLKQGTLSTPGRVKNVQNAFQVRSGIKLKGKRVLLVDDVMTSCATANEVSKVLKDNGALEVTVAIAARGVGGH